MKKIILVFIVSVLLVGLVVAGVVGTWNRDIDIDNEKLAKILEHTNEKTISPMTSEIICNNKECSAKIYQEDIIQTEFRTLKEYCSEYSVCEEEKVEIDCEVICLKYTDYTEIELKQMLDNYIKQRLETYADALIERDNKGIDTKVADGGTATIK